MSNGIDYHEEINLKYRILRELEDRLDLANMAKAKTESEGTIPYEEARKELGP